MLTIYFSGTGNTKYIAELFSQKMGANCLSIEADVDFQAEIIAHDSIAFCYPILWIKIITQKNDCAACYRCVNLCPCKAITVTMFHIKPKWQYQGVICKAEVGTGDEVLRKGEKCGIIVS